eukprot:jgi/Ulvmu1/6792/UM030_0130.1
MGLVESRDFVRVCLGEGGFKYMIEALAGESSEFGDCDLGVSSITASTEREQRGIRFSRATHRSALAILVHAPLQKRGMWAFFEPLHFHVWMALLVTIVVTPLFVFFSEAVFSKWTAYMHGEKLDIVSGLRECLWHSISHTLSIDVFKVRSLPARIITAAYAFLVLILTNTYTANLAAFLTVDQLDTTISSIDDLRGKSVATIEPYVSRLYRNHHVVGNPGDGWEYDVMISKLRRGDYAAVISDDTQLISRAYADESCSLHILGDMIEPFDLAVAFGRGFTDDFFRRAVSSTLLDMQEDGTLSELKSEHEPPEPKCLSEATEFSETNQVEVSSLWGLWVILALAVGLAAGAGGIEYTLKWRRKHEDVDHINERVGQIRAKMSGAVSMHRATSAFWSTLERPRRSSSATSSARPAGGKLASCDLEAGPSATAAAPAESALKPQGALWNRAALLASKSMRHVAEPSMAEESDAAGKAAPCSPPPGALKRHITKPASLKARDASATSSAAAAGAYAAGPPQSSDSEAPSQHAAQISFSNCMLHPAGRAISRQTSMGSAGPEQGSGAGAGGSLCVCSIGARSDIVDEPDEHAVEDEGVGRMALHLTVLNGQPQVCLGAAPAPEQQGGAATRPPGLNAAGAEFADDLDAELVQLNSVVQAAAHRVSVLCQTRRLLRRQPSQR